MEIWKYVPPSLTHSLLQQYRIRGEYGSEDVPVKLLSFLVSTGYVNSQAGKDVEKIIIIAGPNGSGKTTFAWDFLPREAQTLRFINADLICQNCHHFLQSRGAFGGVGDHNETVAQMFE